MMQTRMVLFEIHRVLDTQRTEVADLLAPGSAPMLVVDRSLAASGLRFATFLAWTFELSHFWRLSGSAVMVSALGPFPPLTVVTEVVRHLGGPSAEPGMFTLDEVSHRLRQAMASFATTAEAMAELAAQGATRLEDLHELTEDRLSEERFAMLVPVLLQVWFTFVPPGCAGPDLDIEDLAAAWDGVAADLERVLQERGQSVTDVLAVHCRQPVLAQAAAGELLKFQGQLPKKQRFNQDEKLTALVALRAATNALDRALRQTASPFA